MHLPKRITTFVGVNIELYGCATSSYTLIAQFIQIHATTFEIMNNYHYIDDSS